MMGRFRTGLAITCICTLASCGAQAGTCRQALALGLDVSGSVDAAEYRLQMDGLASALAHPDVTALILSVSSDPVRLLVYEWSGPQDRRIVVDWTEISDAESLSGIVMRLKGTKRVASNPATALGRAMTYGAELLATQHECLKHTLDISSDGESNSGPRPQDVAAQPILAKVVVNALVIGSDGPGGGVRTGELNDLETYFSTLVIRGPRAFVESAGNFADFQAAMVRKLLREVEGLALSALDPNPQHPLQTGAAADQ